jgi:hypothetical protein
MKKYLFVLLLVASSAYAETAFRVSCDQGASATGTMGWIGTYRLMNGNTVRLWFSYANFCPTEVNIQ